MSHRAKTFRGAGRPLLMALAGTLLLGTVLQSCSEKITVDSSFTTPEGVPSGDAQLVVWYDLPVEREIYTDNLPLGGSIDEFCGTLSAGPEDVLIRRDVPDTSRTIRGMIFDGTRSTSYQLLRREAGGGFRQFMDFMARPATRWLTTGWEMYSFTDPNPSSFQPASYRGRGAVSGTVTSNSVLTNEAVVGDPGIADIQYTGICNPCDSLFTLRWKSVPGAARYLMHVYQFSPAPGAQALLRSSAPAPINDVQSFDIFLGIMSPIPPSATPDTSYKLGSPPRPDVTVLMSRPMRFGLTYFVRVSAIDSLGRMVAFTRGDYARTPGDGIYTLFRRGAYTVGPQRPPRCIQER